MFNFLKRKKIKETKVYCVNCHYGHRSAFMNNYCKKVIEVRYIDNPWEIEVVKRRLRYEEQNKNNDCQFYRKRSFFSEVIEAIGFM